MLLCEWFWEKNSMQIGPMFWGRCGLIDHYLFNDNVWFDKVFDKKLITIEISNCKCSGKLMITLIKDIKTKWLK